nr:hypothetical protein [uncultured Desulfuromonas sp.]
MGKCLKGKSTVKRQEATVKCARCGALTDKKKNVCCGEKVDEKTAKKKTEQGKKKSGKG